MTFRQIAKKPLERHTRSLHADLDAILTVRHPSRQRVLVGQPEHERPEPDALYRAPHENRACSHVVCSSETRHPRPCQPTSTTLPVSTSTGTVCRELPNSRSRARADGSVSTSYSTKSRPSHSSHSRISFV